ncbi:hypothetical protein NEOC65_001873 [Neochlamydia sp. AcF65]|uniref:hypothetical protein n=1 Tax=Neochlamydia sp. AcF65 TaxID=2795735 RepID=UPI001BCA4A3C|nr:hypothetical protein [Neochlamydia sp. AcF65]MBS4166779.1 hypothetical protein [Neochlamydia sp. AcF65]
MNIIKYAPVPQNFSCYGKVSHFCKKATSFMPGCFSRKVSKLIDYSPTKSKCVMAWSLFLIAFPASMKDYSSFDFSATSLTHTVIYTILLSNALLITILYRKNTLKNQRREEPDSMNSERRPFLNSIKSLFAGPFFWRESKKSSIEKQSEFLILLSMKEIQKLKHKQAILLTLIDQHSDLKELFEKYKENHAPFVAKVDFKLTPISENDDVYERLEKTIKEQRYLEHILRELEVYVKSYEDLHTCLLEKVRFYNEQQSYRKGQERIIEVD